MKAVFLDRDGTLNYDPGYLNDPAELRLYPQVGEALRALKEKGFYLIVVTNQSGLSRGLVDAQGLHRIHLTMNEMLGDYGVQIDRFEFCSHLPEDLCQCRKPSPFLLRKAATDMNLDLTQSYMVGDRLSDIEAGRSAKCQGVGLVRTGEGRITELQIKRNQVDFIGNTLLEVAHWILKTEANEN